MLRIGDKAPTTAAQQPANLQAQGRRSGARAGAQGGQSVRHKARDSSMVGMKESVKKMEKQQEAIAQLETNIHLANKNLTVAKAKGAKRIQVKKIEILLGTTGPIDLLIKL